MARVCPKCGAENSDQAKYCDQCAAPLTPDPAAEATGNAKPAAGSALAGSPINWMALFLVAVVIGAVAWLLVPHAKPGMGEGAAAMGGGMGAGAGMENPHAQGGADAGGGGMNADITQQLDGAKTALKNNPLDVEALSTMYSMYGAIGRQQQVRPFLDGAYAELVKRRAELGTGAMDTLVGLVSAAMLGGDSEGALSILTQYHQLEPANAPLLGILGDVCFDMDKKEDAIKWYTQYLDQAQPAEADEAYWRVRTDRAVMYLQLGKPVNGKAGAELAISELEGVTQQAAKFWSGWFNLGLAYNTVGRKEQAKQAWRQALALSKGELEKWQVEAELAKLEGKEPPPQPANPHGGMGMGEGMANPHGGMPNPDGGAENPHGGMGEGAGQGSSGI